MTPKKTSAVLIALSFLFFFTSVCYADDDAELTPKSDVLSSRTVSATFGHEHVFNSYLSPILHRGISLGAFTQTLRANAFRTENFCTQSRNHLFASLCCGQYETCVLYNFVERFDFDFLYNFSLGHNFKIFAGAGLGMELGADLHLTNSNNPVFARAKISFINLTAMPTYVLRTKRRQIIFRDQFAISMLGLAIAPEYTEIYFDLIYPSNNVKSAVCLTHPGRDISFSNHLMILLPLRRNTMSVGCLVNRAVRRINANEYRDLTVALTLGFGFDYKKNRGRLNQATNAYNK